MNNAKKTAYKKTVTGDKSITFISSKYDEAYHSLTGAREEAFKKYSEPCRIKELAKKGNIKILDVCFGLGYNSAAALETALKANPDCKIEIIALENDEGILKKALTLEPDIEHCDLIKETIKNKDKTFENKQIKIKIIINDARESIKLVIKNKTKFDAVFFDPFSPRKCPELWTEEFFSDVNTVMKKGAILATYSCAKPVRRNMENAGFIVKDGPIVRRWSPGTLGIKK
jgi:tRNA U34 5-methylaminomethyl-2-thiouridine-forming methyltransferase MnmC